MMDHISITMETDLRSKTLRQVSVDPVKSAKVADLSYVTDANEGILRRVKDNGFEYYFRNKKICNQKKLDRIKKLTIPPAWTKVWICPYENGHLQATGFDARSRKQYRYHSRWIQLRGMTKFHRLLEFGRALPEIRKMLQKDLRLQGLPFRKVLAALVSLMEETNIRIGSALYERLYGSYGLVTLKDKHVKLKGGTIRFIFTGKKGVSHDISIRNKKLATIITRCKEIPGKHLFQYYDDQDVIQGIHSGDINEYIREISGTDFSSKDFRTWAGSVGFIREFIEMMTGQEDHPGKKELVSIIDRVARNLGNTRSVCRKYYIHPRVTKYFENGRLEKFTVTRKKGKWMEPEERLLLKILNSKTR